MTTRIKLRRDTASNWIDVNPVLALGEAGYDTTNNVLRVGDGTSHWMDLSPIGGGLPLGMLADLWYGAPNLTNDLTANSDSNYMQFQTQTNWVGNNDYGRSTLSWHDSEVSLYSHVQADPYGVSIRNAEWFDGYQARYWEFNRDGTTRFPNGMIFDEWNDANISNDYIKLYESDNTGESGGQDNAYVIQMQSTTKWWNNEDYGRATLSWHDYDYSNYSHIHVDPNGASIRLADWSGNRGNYTQYWNFNTDGTMSFPTGYGGPSTYQRFGMGNLFVYSDGGQTISEFNTGTNNWGDDGIRINPGLEGPVDINLPNNTTANVTPLSISNWAGGGVTINSTPDGGGYANAWTFSGNGVTTLPQGGTNTTSMLGQGPDSDWVNPNNHTWSIRQYNGGFNFTYTGTAGPTIWFDPANSPLGGDQFRGAIIEYHAYVNGASFGGTVVGQIIVAQDQTFEPTHTENMGFYDSNGLGAATIKFWDRPSGATLGYSNSALTDQQSDNVMIMWTAKVFYGQEFAC